jgi:nucleoid-associated protein YgaU
MATTTEEGAAVFVCPVCDTENRGEPTCRVCDIDLGPLHRYHEALREIEAGTKAGTAPGPRPFPFVAVGGVIAVMGLLIALGWWRMEPPPPPPVDRGGVDVFLAANPGLVPDVLSKYGYRPGLATPEPTAAEPASHVVKPGETLTTIARNRYGSGRFWVQIGEANRLHVTDPDRLKVGDRLVLPTVTVTPR